MKTGTELITDERARQVALEGWSFAHDDTHDLGEMAAAAAVYAMPGSDGRPCFCNSSRSEPSSVCPLHSSATWAPKAWPWSAHWFKPGPDRIRTLVKAGALIAAEIDRLQRRATNEGGSET